MLLFRLPFDEAFYTLNETGKDTEFSFHSFDGTSVLKIGGKLQKLTVDEIKNSCFTLPENINTLEKNETKEEYLSKIEKSIECIKENHLKKLVIARKKTILFQDLNIAESFINLCKNYSSAFVYVFSENGICWMGAFSEVLGKFDKKNSEFETMSLAGTLPIEEKWTEKEIKEQKPVTDYIFEILKKYAPEIQRSETYDHISGNIKHLRTNFKLKTDLSKVDSLLSELHPTPAVCGIPKEFCKESILKLEQFSREFYAGFSKIEIDDILYSFVNLRCGKLHKNSAELFAGGGITSLSNPENEWRETELKMQALEKSLVYNSN